MFDHCSQYFLNKSVQWWNCNLFVIFTQNCISAPSSQIFSLNNKSIQSVSRSVGYYRKDRIMTTYGQKQFEALGLLEKKHTTTVKVTSTITNDPSRLTNRELEDVTSVFRSLIYYVFWLSNYTKKISNGSQISYVLLVLLIFRSLETGLREATIDPSVIKLIIKKAETNW